METKIKNKDFKVGQVFRGDINQEIFEVVDIKILNNTKYIYFKSRNNGYISERNIQTAQRLLITEVENG